MYFSGLIRTFSSRPSLDYSLPMRPPVFEKFRIMPDRRQVVRPVAKDLASDMDPPVSAHLFTQS
jgi:hypothetical protein